ncbi:MAG TPA: metalloregulator ArsR/SmtB family transcription factor [Xanthobacteraceae bacterium]|jgi:DNA-binding transcriptional ArsR family regulator
MPELPSLFGALSDPTRLAIVERLLREGERSVGELARPLPVTLPAVSRHMRVLEEAGIVEHRVDRQWRRYRVRAQALRDIDEWMATYRTFWTASLDRLERMVEKRRRK